MFRMEQFTEPVEDQNNDQPVAPTNSLHQLSTLRPLLPPMHGRLRAPLGGETADGLVDLLVEAEEIADDAAVEEGAVGVGVGEEGGEQVLLAELVENHFSHEKLLVGEAAEVKHGEGFRRPYRDPSPASQLAI